MTEKRIARVFATQTKYTPQGPDVYYGPPDLFAPQYDTAEISITFTWDLKKEDMLTETWKRNAKRIRVGGPAITRGHMPFEPGQYLRPGITITSRGCPRKCPLCFVPRWEGSLKELDIYPGNIIQDNNLLACSQGHIDKVFKMLRKQKEIEFAGGLDIYRFKENTIEALRGLRIKHIWLAYDSTDHRLQFKTTVKRLRRYFTRHKTRAYVLIGQPGDTIDQAESRLIEAYEAGTLPFAMLYRDEEGKQRSQEWKRFARAWALPAIINTRAKYGWPKWR